MKKILAFGLAAATLGTVIAASASDAEARRFRGIGIGIAVVGAPYVYTPEIDEPVRYATDCRYVERYNRYGEYVGLRRICRVLPY